MMIITDIFNSAGTYLRTATAPADQPQSLPGEIAVVRTADVTGPMYYDIESARVMPAGDPPDLFNYFFDVSVKQWVDRRTIDDIKQQAWSTIKRARDAALTAPLPTEFGLFDATEKAQASIMSTVIMMQALDAASTPITVDFTLADNTVVTLTTAQLVQVAAELGQRTQAIYANSRDKRAQIDAATTVAEVNAVVW